MGLSAVPGGVVTMPSAQPKGTGVTRRCRGARDPRCLALARARTSASIVTGPYQQAAAHTGEVSWTLAQIPIP